MKSVILTHLRPDVWQYKAGFAFRKKGIKTISISLLSVDKKSAKDSFDEVISLDLKDMKPKTILKSFIKNPTKNLNFFYRVLTIRANYAICQGAPHYLSSLFLRIFKGKFPTVYFPYDMSLSVFKKIEDFIPKREIFGEKYCFNNSDGFIYKTSEEELRFMPKELKLFNKPRILFPAYVLEGWSTDPDPKEKLSRLDNELHLVWPGGYPKKEGNHVIALSEIFKPIVAQKIHLHFYLVPGNKIPKDQLKDIAPTKELKKFVHVHDFVSPENLSKEISKYDFGINTYKYTGDAKKGSIKFFAANKTTSYFEAGLPMMINKELEIYASMIKKEGVGLVIDSDFSGIKNKVKNSNYEEMVENVKIFRKKYSFENNIQRMIDFLDSLPSK